MLATLLAKCARLDAESLKAVTQSVVGLKTLSDGMRGSFALAMPSEQSFDVSDTVPQIKVLREEATVAYNALAKLAEEPGPRRLPHSDT